MTTWYDDWNNESRGILTGCNNCEIIAYHYSVREEPKVFSKIQAIFWEPRENPANYKGQVIFTEYMDKPPLEFPLLFWIKVCIFNEEDESVEMNFNQVELLEPFTGYDKAYSFIARNKTKFKTKGE